MALLVRRREMGPRSMQRVQPFRELQELQEQTSQLLEQVLSGAVPTVADVPVWVPDVDIEETEDAWIVEAELPGAKAENVHVELNENELVIRGEITERERAGIIRRRTRRVGQFEYRVTLPGQVAGEQPEARLHEGVLTVRIPKPEPSRAREIQVQSGGDGGAVQGGAQGGDTSAPPQQS
jgi:HSP20 family protein